MKNSKRNKNNLINFNPINESLDKLYDFLKIQQNRFKQQDIINKIKDQIDKEINKIKTTEYEELFKVYDPIPLQKVIYKGNKNMIEDLALYVVKHIPTGTWLLVNFQPKNIIAVRISHYTNSDAKSGSIQEIKDNDKLQNDDYNRMIRDDFEKAYGRSVIAGNNKISLMREIQPYTRDDDNNPMPANKEVAKQIASAIEKITKIKIDYRDFCQTRAPKSERKQHTSDYLYIGGFNIKDDVTVRISRYRGTINQFYNIYHVYVRYCDYAFMLRIEYSLKSIIVHGGITSGVSWDMLKEKGYIDPVNDIRPKQDASRINNIYTFFNKLNGDNFIFKVNIDGTGAKPETMANIILKKISDIIRQKEMMDRAITSQAARNLKDITFKNIEKEYSEVSDKLKKLQEKDPNANWSSTDKKSSTEDTSDDDYGFDD